MPLVYLSITYVHQAQIAEESSSVEITALDVASALQEIDAVLGWIELHGNEMSEGDNFQTPTDENLDFNMLTAENVAKVKCMHLFKSLYHVYKRFSLICVKGIFPFLLLVFPHFL